MRGLEAAIASGRIHHAWIFSGPMGVGKRTAAEAFAAAILDPTTQPDLSGRYAPDENSQTQRLIAQGMHADLHIITKELALFHPDPKIREAKQITIAKKVVEQHLLGPIAKAPVYATDSLVGKVFIIDEAELLDRSRFHAPSQVSILKTLEEPPPRSVIILVTSSEDALLPTIRSRCQRIVFFPLEEPAMNEWFKRSGIAAAGPEKKWLLDFAQGSPGRALLAHQTGLYAWHEALEPLLAEAERGRYPGALGPTMAKLVDDWAKAWVEPRENASKEAANQAGARHLFSLLSERARRSLRTAAAKTDERIIERRLGAIDAIADAERFVSASVPIPFAMEDLAGHLSREF